MRKPARSSWVSRTPGPATARSAVIGWPRSRASTASALSAATCWRASSRSCRGTREQPPAPSASRRAPPMISRARDPTSEATSSVTAEAIPDSSDTGRKEAARPVPVVSRTISSTGRSSPSRRLGSSFSSASTRAWAARIPCWNACWLTVVRPQYWAIGWSSKPAIEMSVGAVDPAAAEDGEGAEGQLVGVAEHRRRPGPRPVQQLGHRLLALGGMAVAGGDHVGRRQVQPGRHERRAQALGAVLPDAVVGLAGDAAVDHHDPAVAETDQVLADQPAARPVVDVDAGHAGQRGAARDRRHPGRVLPGGGLARWRSCRPAAARPGRGRPPARRTAGGRWPTRGPGRPSRRRG